jgi:hypothetical protein
LCLGDSEQLAAFLFTPAGFGRRQVFTGTVTAFSGFYTTNAIEASNAKLRRAVRARGHFPNDEAATKLTLPGLAPGRSGMENAASRMGRSKNPVRHHVRRTLRKNLMEIRPRARDSGRSRGTPRAPTLLMLVEALLLPRTTPDASPALIA